MADKFKKMDYDDLLKLHVGEFGRYQRIVVVLVALTCVPGVINSLNIVFLAAVPDHFCHSPSAAHLNLSREDLLNLTTPTKDRQCSQYDQNYSDWTSEQAIEMLNKTLPENLTVIQCQSGWDYDNSTYQSTIVTEWNLVCDKKALVPTAASVFMTGLTLGVMICGYLSDRYGRKMVCICCSILMVVFAMAIPFSPNYMTFIILRFFLGMPTFGLITTALVLSVEMVGPSRRILAGTVIWSCWPFGYVVIAAVAYRLRKWQHLAIALAAPQVLVLITTLIIPESPRWLYSKQKVEKAEAIVRKMAKMNNVKLPEEVKVEVAKHSNANVCDLFRYRKLRQRTLILFLIWFVNSVVYYGLSLNTSNLGGSDYITFFIAGAVEFPALVFYQLSSEYLGRRKTTAGTMVVGGLSLLGIAAVPKDLQTVIITLAMVGKFCITVSFNLVYIFSAEIYPTIVRSVGVASGSFWARVGSIVAPYIGSLMQLNKVIPYILLGALSIIAGLLALILPETKGQQLPESIEDGENFPMLTLSDPVTVQSTKPSKDEPA